MTTPSLPAERSVLGSLLHQPNRLADLDGLLEVADFADDRHRVLFSAIVEMLAAAVEPTEVSLFVWLQDSGTLNAAGGATYLGTLRDELPDASNIMHYAKIVRDRATVRKIQTVAKTTLGACEKAGGPEPILESLAASVADLQAHRSGASVISIGKAAAEELDRIRADSKREKRDTGVETGFQQIDATVGGLRPGQLVVIGARTSVGKTAFALQAALWCAQAQGKGVLFVSLEMSKEELSRRALAQVARISLGRITHGHLSDPRWPETEGYWQLADAAGKELSSCPLTIVESGAYNPTTLRSRCRAEQMRNQVDLVVVDYLQLMRSGERHQNRTEEVSAISRSLKLMAKDLRVPVLACCQLNREAARRDDGKPMQEAAKSRGEPRKEDLRESGSIENDADIIILLHRIVESPNMDELTYAHAILAKHRNGPTGRWRLKFDPPTCRFSEV